MPALPATFNDFLGNSTAVEHLRTAIAAGRLPHSLILAGPSGAGKYTLALMLAMAVECERQPPDPPQLLIKLGQIRTLIQRAHYLPSEAPKRIFILTASSFMKEAANSLLKVLEEPPDTVHVILLAENPGELLPTIRSRCATVRLGALPVEEIEMLLADRRPD